MHLKLFSIKPGTVASIKPEGICKRLLYPKTINNHFLQSFQDCPIKYKLSTNISNLNLKKKGCKCETVVHFYIANEIGV